MTDKGYVMSSNIIVMKDQDEMDYVFISLSSFGEIGDTFYVDDEINKFSIYNNCRVLGTLQDFNLITYKTSVELSNTAGTLYITL